MKKNEVIFGLALAILAALILWLLNRAGLLHETVSATVITGGIVSFDPATGLPRYDTRFPQTVPKQEAQAIRPIQSDGRVSEFGNAATASCPIGYQLWINAANGGSWCLPE